MGRLPWPHKIANFVADWASCALRTDGPRANLHLFHFTAYLRIWSRDTAVSKLRRIVRPVRSTAPPLVRNAHIVPRFYLNKFADRSKFIFVYASGRDPQLRSTKSVSSEEDYFECTVNGEATANRYETWFQRFETDAAAIYSTIHDGQQITSKDQIVWSSFVATVFLRSRKVREQFGPTLTRAMDAENYDSEEKIREMQCELLNQGIFVYSEDIRARVKQTLEEMRAPAFGQLAGIEASAKMITKNIIEKKTWWILEAAHGREFVTSDCPVQTWALNGPKAPITMGSGFGHQNTAVVFPLSPKKLFFAGNDIRWTSKVLSEEDTDKVNTATVQFAHRAVYALTRSPETQALVDRELDKYTFGENCFIPAKPQA